MNGLRKRKKLKTFSFLIFIFCSNVFDGQRLFSGQIMKKDMLLFQAVHQMKQVTLTK